MLLNGFPSHQYMISGTLFFSVTNFNSIHEDNKKSVVTKLIQANFLCFYRTHTSNQLLIKGT